MVLFCNNGRCSDAPEQQTVRLNLPPATSRCTVLLLGGHIRAVRRDIAGGWPGAVGKEDWPRRPDRREPCVHFRFHLFRRESVSLCSCFGSLFFIHLFLHSDRKRSILHIQFKGLTVLLFLFISLFPPGLLLRFKKSVHLTVTARRIIIFFK